MSHSTTFEYYDSYEDKRYEATFIHNGDYSGDTTIALKGMALRLSIPTPLLLMFVASVVADEKISFYEEANYKEVLGLK